MTQTATVTLRIDAKQADALAALLRTKGALADVGTAGQQGGEKAARGLDKTTEAARKTEQSLESAKRAVLGLAAGISVFTVGRQLIQTADQYANITAKLQLATAASGGFAQAQRDVFAIAQQTSASLDSTTTLYARLTQATETLGVSQSKVADVTRAINQAFIVSGTSTAAADGAITQLAQAFASGTLRGDEFNSVNEAAPRIMKALADSLGVPVGKLRELAEQGKLTSEILFNALSGEQAQKIADEAAKIPVTVSRAYQQLGNALTQYVGQTDQALGASKLISDVLVLVSKNLDAVFIAATAVTTVIGVRYVQGVLTARAATAALAASTGVAATSAGVLGRAMGLFGGPAGLAITALTTLPLLFSALQPAAAEGADGVRTLTEEIDQYIAAQGRLNSVPATREALINRALADRERLTQRAIELQAELDRAYTVTGDRQEAAVLLATGALNRNAEKVAALDAQISKLTFTSESFGARALSAFNQAAQGGFNFADAIDFASQAYDRLRGRVTNGDLGAQLKKAGDELTKALSGAQEQLLRAQGKNPQIEAFRALAAEAAKAGGANKELAEKLALVADQLAATEAKTKSVTEANRTFTASQKESKTATENQADAFKDLLKLNNDLALSFAGPLAQAQEQNSDRVAKIGELYRKAGGDAKALRVALESLAAADRILTDETVKAEAAEQERIDTLNKAIRAANDYALTLGDETKLLALSSKERAIVEAGIRAEIKERELLNEAIKLGAQYTQEEQAAMITNAGERARQAEGQNEVARAAGQAADEYQRSWENASQSVSDAFGDFVTGGIKSFSDFGDALKNIAKRFLSDLVSQFVKTKLIEPLFGQLSGASGGGGIGGLLGGIFGGGGQGGGILDILGGLLGGAGKKGKDGLGGLGLVPRIGNAIGYGQIGGALAGLLGGNSTAATIGGTLGGIFGPIGSAIGAAIGGAFGTSYKPTGAGGQTISIGPSGVSGTNQIEESRRRSFYRGTQTRTVNSAIDPSALTAIDSAFNTIRQRLGVNAASVGAVLGESLTATFRTVQDKTGKVTRQFIEILGRQFDGTSEELGTRLEAEENLRLLTQVAGNMVQSIAEPFRATSGGLLDVSQALLAAQIDIKNGAGLLGNLGLDRIAPLLTDTQGANESLVQTYVRLVQSAGLLDQAIALSGTTLNKTREEYVRFAAGIADAAGGLDAANALWSSYYENFFSETERAQARANALLEQSSAAIKELGLTLTGSTTQERLASFREQFTRALPTLTAEQVVQYLRAGELIGAYGDALAALEPEVVDNTAALQAAADALANYTDLIGGLRTQFARIGFTEFENEIASVGDWQAETVARIVELARAAGYQGNVTQDLGLVSTIASERIRQAVARIVASARAIAQRLYGGNTNAAQQQTNQGFSDVSSGLNQVFEDWQRGLQSISDFLNQQVFSQFSSATPQERLAEAQRQFAALLAQAQAGNAQALQQLPNAANQLLQQAASFFSSGTGFVEIERFIRTALAGLSGVQPVGTGPVVGTGGGSTSGPSDLSPEEIEANRRELAQQLAEYVRQIVSAQGTSLAALSETIGFSVAELVRDLGLNLGVLSVETVTALAGVAASLGVELTELAQETGVSLGMLRDQNSLINDALEAAIEKLPKGQRDELEKLFKAVENATTEADANKAIKALEDKVKEIGGSTATALAPYLQNVDPPSAQAQLNASQSIARDATDTLKEIKIANTKADEQVRLLGEIEKAIKGGSVTTALAFTQVGAGIAATIAGEGKRSRDAAQLARAPSVQE